MGRVNTNYLNAKLRDGSWNHKWIYIYTNHIKYNVSCICKNTNVGGYLHVNISQIHNNPQSIMAHQL